MKFEEVVLVSACRDGQLLAQANIDALDECLKLDLSEPDCAALMSATCAIAIACWWFLLSPERYGVHRPFPRVPA
jgi:hypothetical protein